MILIGLIMFGIFVVLLFYVPLMYFAKAVLNMFNSASNNIVVRITGTILIGAFMLLLTVFSIAMIAFIII